MTSPVLAPRAWGVHLLVLLAVAAAGWLGWWQFGAWQAHRDAAAQDLTHASPIPLDRAIGPDDPMTGDVLGRPVEVSGRWMDLQIDADRPGGAWLVDFVRTDSGSAIPVVRGWYDGGDEPLPPTGNVDLVGWLQPSQDLVHDPDPHGSSNDVSGVSIPDLVQKTGVDLYSGFVVLDHARADGTDVTGLRQAHLEESPSAGTWPGARNLFYGVEWWFFAGFAIFLWIKWMRDETREQAATEDAVPSNA